MSNVIDVDFGEKDVERKVRDLFSQVARKRGYSPDRAAEIASIICAAVNAMQGVAVPVGRTAPESSVAEVNAAIQSAIRQTVNHCSLQFVESAMDLCYPVR